jgi:DNA (cytosine-5)-methyltransferase 1
MSQIVPAELQKMNSKSEFAILREKAGVPVDELARLCGRTKRTIYRWENGASRPEKLAVEKLEHMIRGSVTDNDAATPSFTFIDLFAGIGGLRRGFEPLGGKCVFTSEWNKYSQETYRANYGSLENIAGDITKIEANTIPAHDLLLAGFPCQPFSIAGVSKKNALHQPHGFACETQGTLFFDVARIIKYHRPRAFLLENVKNLVNHDKGKTFAVIRHVLEEELGYQVRYRVIDARSWVPQHRERIIIVGFRDPNGFTMDDLKLPDPLSGPFLGSILHPEDGSEQVTASNNRYIEGIQGNVKSKYTLSDHLWDYLKAYAQKHREKGNGFGFGLFGPSEIARTLSARYYKDGSEILIMREDGNPRRLTPRECARLMGFDGRGESEFVIPVSDTQAYKQFGNAVVVPMVEAVARHMLPWLVPVQLEFNNILKDEDLVAVG